MTAHIGKETVRLFLLPENGEKLRNALIDLFPGNLRVKNYLMANFNNHHRIHAEQLRTDHMYSYHASPVYKGSHYPDMNLECVNTEFMTQMRDFIKRDLLRHTPDLVSSGYNLTDGNLRNGMRFTTRRVLCDKDTSDIDDPEKAHWHPSNKDYGRQDFTIRPGAHFKDIAIWGYRKPNEESTARANMKLEQWRYPSSSVRASMRDDPKAIYGSESRNHYGTYAPEHHIEYDDDEGEQRYDIVDELLSTPYIQSLNQQYGQVDKPNPLSSTWERGKYGAKSSCNDCPQNDVRFYHRGNGFMNEDNPVEMEKYMNRRVFRSYNGRAGGAIPHGDSAAEQIPFFEKRLYQRDFDRDADESVGGFETDAIVRGYGKDALSLYCRIPQKITCGKTNGYKDTGRAMKTDGEIVKRDSRFGEFNYRDNSYQPAWEFIV